MRGAQWRESGSTALCPRALQLHFSLLRFAPVASWLAAEATPSSTGAAHLRFALSPHAHAKMAELQMVTRTRCTAANDATAMSRSGAHASLLCFVALCVSAELGGPDVRGVHPARPLFLAALVHLPRIQRRKVAVGSMDHLRARGARAAWFLQTVASIHHRESGQANKSTAEQRREGADTRDERRAHRRLLLRALWQSVPVDSIYAQSLRQRILTHAFCVRPLFALVVVLFSPLRLKRALSLYPLRCSTR